MTFISPLGLIALLAIPAVVALHVFRRRFRERRVGGLFLFAPDRLRATAGRKRTRLLRSASLLCELAAALLAALWLGGLSLGGTSRSVHAVLVLDDSASMAARNRGVSAADRARAMVREVLDELPAGAFATVILTGARPEILLGPSELATSMPSVLGDWRPWRPSHDPSAALDLGVELAGPGGQLWFFTDRLEPETVPPRYAIRAVGRKAPNAAILAARREPGAERETLYADLCAFASGPFETTLTVHAIADDGVRELASRSVVLESEQPLHLSLELPVTRAPIAVELGRDALALDSSFTLLPRPPRTVQAAVALGEDVAAALEVERVLAAVPGVRRVESAADAHLVLGEDPAGVHHEVLIAPIGAEERDAWLGPYLIERRDALCDGLTLDGVVWTAGRGDLDGLPIVLAGSQPLVARASHGERLRLVVNLDPLRSNFATSPDWPILLTNVCEYVRALLPGSPEPNVLVGGLLEWRDDAASGRELRLVDPFGRERPGRGLRVVTWRAEHPGEHRLVRGGDEVARFQVNFADAHESDLRGVDEGSREAEAVAEDGVATAAASGRIEGRVLALLLLLAILLDWLVLRRGGGSA